MKYLSSILIALFVMIVTFSCRPPGKDYKLTKQQSKRVHQDFVYKKNKIDKTRDAEKIARKEQESERLRHNLRVANSRNPAKKAQVKQKNPPFNHH